MRAVAEVPSPIRLSRMESLALVLSLRVPLQSWRRLWERCRGGLSLQTVTQLDQACLRKADEALILPAAFADTIFTKADLDITG